MAVTPRMIDAGVHIGEIFLDKYRVDSILGHGGMGIVALCTHLALNERVAIKMLRRDVLDDADAVERFMREAQAASKLRSEYVARVTDVGRSAKNVPYMVMEYLEGHDLGELLDERGSLAPTWAVELTLQACEALAEAHSIGIIHRDVKPSNLFVTWRPDGSALVKVLDFGISKAPTTNGIQLTQTQSMLGTPAYMSPEQMRSARMVDARTDIWSLGTVLYEVLEGHRPFEAESFSEMCVKVAVDPPGPMLHTPPALQQVVLRCLEKLPELRYESMAELGRALVAFSHDPHQAQVLVERMARTLRRSQIVEWDPTSNGHELRSAERRAELAAGLSNPAISVPRTALPMLAPPAVPEVRGEAATGASLSQTFSVNRPKRRTTIVTIVAAAIAATALGVVVSLARSGPAQREAPPRPAAPSPIAVEPTAPAGVTPVPAVAEGAGSDDPAVAAPEVRPEPPGVGSSGRKIKPTRPAIVPKTSDVTPEPKPVLPPCDDTDPFGEPHAKSGAPCTPRGAR